MSDTKDSKPIGVAQNFGRYGWLTFTPDYLQKFLCPKWALAFCCPGPFLQGMLIMGLLHFFIPHLERQFELRSTQSGLISSAYDMAATICLIPLATIGGRSGANRPKYIGIGLIIIGTGAFIFSLPAFLSGPYNNVVLKELCIEGEVERIMEPPSQNVGWILFFGNLLQGAGATPIYSIAVTYIDDCFPVHSSSFYMGIYYTMAVLGPLTGIAIAGGLSLVSVNFLTYPNFLKDELDPENPTWVGCWWLGFVIGGLLCYLFSVPLLGLPSEMAEMEQNHPLCTRDNILKFEKISELPVAFRRLFKNLKFIFLTLAACCEGIIFSGMSAFLTKILMQQFGLGPKNQAVYKAVLVIPSSLIGILGGGWVIKFFGMNLQQILTMIVCLVSISFPCISAMFIYCNHDELVGFGDMNKNHLKGKSQLVAECNSNCSCDESFFFPICGLDKLTYFSGCHAGCTRKDVKKDVDMFYDCKCIVNKKESEPDAVEGFCTNGCPSFMIFVVLVFTYQILSFFCIVPTITCTLRVVHADIRSLGIALQWVMGRLLGTIPGPLLFGKAIDDSCGYWQKNSDGSLGNCLHYDHLTLARNLALVMFASKGLQITFFAIALRLAIKTQRERMNDPEIVHSTIW
ncbi:solute carrier organic anion transporter family member 4A1 isoform X2 [Halyomorpha halys]|uniref:solute carrier organic anion transporter family member 4A1 isoform X2 n=1 Tax=Halyomorpha halys TaxID=286706 RepID=UPI0006D5066B|nr:solute carrier organic anion transporter family member 4A1 isoform X2 [Halyomorpha halys]